MHLRHKGNQDKIPSFVLNNPTLWTLKFIWYLLIRQLYILTILLLRNNKKSPIHATTFLLSLRLYNLKNRLISCYGIKRRMTLQMSISTISFYLVDRASLLFRRFCYYLPSSFIKTSSSRTEDCYKPSEYSWSTPQSCRKKFSGSCVWIGSAF